MINTHKLRIIIIIMINNINAGIMHHELISI